MDLIEGAAAEYDDDSNHHGKKVSIILTLIRVTCMNYCLTHPLTLAKA